MRRRTIMLLAAMLAAVASGVEEQRTINTIAGGYTGDGLRADSNAIGLSSPSGLAIDDQGNLFIATVDHRIRRIDASTNIIDTFAGTGESGLVGDEGPANRASLNQPADIEFDSAGNLLLVDRLNHVIRRIDLETGVISRVAGTGAGGFAGDGGSALAASFLRPLGLALDGDDNIFVADQFNGRVRRIDAQTGEISTVAGNGGFETSGDGGPAVDAGLDFALLDVAIDSAGNLLVLTSTRVRMVDAATGLIDTLLGGGDAAPDDGVAGTEASFSSIGALLVGDDDDVFVADLGRIYRLDRDSGDLSVVAGSIVGRDDGEVPAADARFFLPAALTFDAQGNLFVADQGNNRIRRIDADLTTVRNVAQGLVGNGTATNVSVLNGPMSIATDSQGNVFLADESHHRIARIESGLRNIDTVAGTGVRGSSGNGGPAVNATLDFPGAVAVGPDAAVYFSQSGTIRRIDPDTGIIDFLTFGPPASFFVMDLDPGGAIFVPNANAHVVRRWDPDTEEWSVVAGTGEPGYSGDGGQATAAQLNFPSDVTVDGDSLLIADTDNHVIRRVDLESGVIETLAGNGDRSTIDSPDPLSASFIDPRRVTRGADGSTFVLERRLLRRIDGLTGAVETYAGNGLEGFSGDGGNALDASFFTGNADIAVDPLGNVYLSDPFTGRVRRIETIRPRQIDPGALPGDAVVGSAVAVDDASVIVGVAGDSVLIYEEIESIETTPAQVLLPPPGAAADFGAVLARSPELLVVGAPGNAAFAKGSESTLQAAIYERLGTSWQFLAGIKGQGAVTADDGFGSSIAISGTTVVVGAPRDDEGEAMASGAVYVFSVQQGLVTLDEKLKPVDPVGGERFGESVALNTDMLVVGSPGAPKPGTSLTAGSATLYDRVAENLMVAGIISPDEGESGDEFGRSLSLAGDVVVVGAPGSGDGSIASGAAFVFDGELLTQRQTLLPSRPSEGGAFGSAVSVSGGQIVIGSPFEPIAPGASGAVYRFDQFVEAERIAAGAGQQAFGLAVAAFDDRIAIGAPATAVAKGGATEGSVGARRVALRFFSNGFERR
ncbi:MAG: hypothetical protein AAGE01_14175 [Pseudomonadota bacterium]